MDASNERLLKLIQASHTQLEQIDQILAGRSFQESTSSSEGPLLLGMGEAAKMLGVSRPTLWRLIQSGRLEKVELLPNSYRIRRADIEALVQKKGGRR